MLTYFDHFVWHGWMFIRVDGHLILGVSHGQGFGDVICNPDRLIVFDDAWMKFVHVFRDVSTYVHLLRSRWIHKLCVVIWQNFVFTFVQLSGKVDSGSTKCCQLLVKIIFSKQLTVIWQACAMCWPIVCAPTFGVDEQANYILVKFIM